MANELTKSQYKDIIGKHFDYSSEFEFLDVVAKVLDRIEDFEDEEGIAESVDSTLILTADQWKVLEFYCMPQDANFDDAYSDFLSDIYELCEEIAAEGEDSQEE